MRSCWVWDVGFTRSIFVPDGLLARNSRQAPLYAGFRRDEPRSNVRFNSAHQLQSNELANRPACSAMFIQWVQVNTQKLTPIQQTTSRSPTRSIDNVDSIVTSRARKRHSHNVSVYRVAANDVNSRNPDSATPVQRMVILSRVGPFMNIESKRSFSTHRKTARKLDTNRKHRLMMRSEVYALEFLQHSHSRKTCN